MMARTWRITLWTSLWLCLAAGCAESSHTTGTALGVSTGEPPPAFVPVQRKEWSFATYPGQTLTTPHYRIHTTLKNDRILERFPVFMEHSLYHYTTALADLPMPARMMQTYLFQDRRQWVAKTRQMMPDQASTFENLGRGGYATRGTAVLYYIDWSGRYRDTFAIAAHEGWHQYTQSTFKQNLPVWLEEGIATYVEGFRMAGATPEFRPSQNAERRQALYESFQSDRLIPLMRILSEPPQVFLKQSKDSLLTYYAQVWALTHFLANGQEERYRDGLAQVLLDAAEGRLARNLMRSATIQNLHGTRKMRSNHPGPWVILAYFDDDLVAFERDYLEYAQTLARGGEIKTADR